MAVGWGNGSEIGGVLILSYAGAGTPAWGPADGLLVSMGTSAGGVELEGSRGRLAAWASSAGEASSCAAGIASRALTLLGNSWSSWKISECLSNS